MDLNFSDQTMAELSESQDQLREKVRRILLDFPFTFLYQSECEIEPNETNQLASFQQFLRIVDRTQKNSPRGELLSQIHNHLRSLYDESSVEGLELRELYAAIKCPREATLLDLQDARAFLAPGKKFKDWSKYHSASTKKNPFDDSVWRLTNQQEMIENYRKKKKPIPSQLELDEITNKLKMQCDQTCEKYKETAEKLWPEVDRDPAYRFWCRMEELWGAPFSSYYYPIFHILL
jgi:hypothetical protein